MMFAARSAAGSALRCLPLQRIFRWRCSTASKRMASASNKEGLQPTVAVISVLRSRANSSPVPFRLDLVLLSGMIGLVGCVRFEPKPLTAPANLVALEARSISDPELGELLLASSQVTEWPPQTWDLRMLTLAALYFHPDLEVARAHWAVVDAGRRTAGERPNPNLGVVPAYNFTTPPDVITPWILRMELNFTLETAGKRGYRIAQSGHLSEAARFDIATVAWQVRSRVRQSLLDLYGAVQLEALLHRRLVIEASIVALAERQLEAGAISPIELTRERLELDAVRLALQDAAHRRAEVRVLLADALGVRVDSLEDIALDFTAFTGDPPDVPPAEAQRQALLNRPDVLSALSAYDATQSALQLEIAMQYPDIHLGPGYEMDQSDQKWGVLVGLTLPILNRNRGPIGEAAARREKAAAEFNAVQTAAIGQLDRALAVYRGAVESLATARSILSDRLEEQRSTEVRYAAGEISRIELNAVQKQVVESELTVLDAGLRSQEALGRLEDAMQSPAGLPDWVLAEPAGSPQATRSGERAGT